MSMLSYVAGLDLWSGVVSLLLLICLAPVTIWLYNIFLHPLAQFPGPLSWRASRIPYLRAVWDGHFPYVVQELHKRYGDVVRVAPDELSFTNPAAWDDIYSNRSGANAEAFPKSQLWHGNPDGGPASVHFITNLKDHARVRRFLDPAFSERAVLQQEPIICQYVDRFIAKLHERSSISGKTTINIADWLNFTLFDIIGDLAFGEPFGCLERCEYEGWMSQMSSSIKVQYFTIHLRHYPKIKNLISTLLGLTIPADIIEQRKSYRQRTVAKMSRRLSTTSTTAVERQDFVAKLLRNEDGKDGLTETEVLLNSMLFINAASETTATTLVGAFNHLLQNPTSLSELEHEVRIIPDSPGLTLQALKRLPYLNAVLKEALRMCNPNPIGHMRITPPKGGVVAGHFVPGDTFVTIQPIALSLSEEHFHEAHAWHPERWLQQAEVDQNSPYYNDKRNAVRAFGHGPYNCIGEPLGWAWMRLILAKIVWSFDVGKAATENSCVEWEKQEVYATVVKQPLDVSLAERMFHHDMT